MKRCRDRNIVQFLGTAVDREQALLVTEFMEAGDLHSALRRDAGGGLLWYRRRVTPAPFGFCLTSQSSGVNMKVSKISTLTGSGKVQGLESLGPIKLAELSM